MKSFSNIGDPYGFPSTEGYSPPQRIISLVGRMQASAGNIPIEVQWGGALLITATTDAAGQASVILPPLKDVPNGWSISLYGLPYSNTQLFVKVGAPTDLFGAATTNYWPGMYVGAGAVYTLMAVDLSSAQGTASTYFPSRDGSSQKRWIYWCQSPAFNGTEGGIGDYGPNQAYMGGMAMGGSNNQSGGAGVVIVGGRNNSTYYNASDAALLGGQNNYAGGQNSIALGGYRLTNDTNASYSTILNGYYSQTKGIRGYTVFNNGQMPFATGSSTKTLSNIGAFELGAVTTDATTTRLRSDSSAASQYNQLALWADEAIACRITIVAHVSSGDSKAWTSDLVIHRQGTGSAAIVGTPAAPTVIGATAGASSWSVAFAADTTYNTLAVNVTGVAATTIRWNCRVDTTEVAY